MKSETFYLKGEKRRSTPYAYKACGLEGIFLLNGVKKEMHDGEEHFSITDIEGLHRAIGRHLVLHRKVLTPREIRFLRNTMDMTQSELAERLWNTSQSVARWEKGHCEIPGAADKLLRAVFLMTIYDGETDAMDPQTFEAFRNLLVSSDLGEMDESSTQPAEFLLDHTWNEKVHATA